MPHLNSILGETRRKFFEFLCRYPCSYSNILAKEFHMSVPGIFHQLRTLRDMGLLKEEKYRGNFVYYPANFIQPEFLPIYKALNGVPHHESLKREFKAILNNPGISLNVLSKETGSAHPTVAGHILELEEHKCIFSLMKKTEKYLFPNYELINELIRSHRNAKLQKAFLGKIKSTVKAQLNLRSDACRKLGSSEKRIDTGKPTERVEFQIKRYGNSLNLNLFMNPMSLLIGEASLLRLSPDLGKDIKLDIFEYLCKYPYSSRRTLETELNLGGRTVDRYADELEKMGLLESERHPTLTLYYPTNFLPPELLDIYKALNGLPNREYIKREFNAILSNPGVSQVELSDKTTISYPNIVNNTKLLEKHKCIYTERGYKSTHAKGERRRTRCFPDYENLRKLFNHHNNAENQEAFLAHIGKIFKAHGIIDTKIQGKFYVPTSAGKSLLYVRLRLVRPDSYFSFRVCMNPTLHLFSREELECLFHSKKQKKDAKITVS